MIPHLILIDIDGVMTDGTKVYDQNHHCVCKQFNDRDFTAIEIFKSFNIKVGFLSADNWNSKMAEIRNIPFYKVINEDLKDGYPDLESLKKSKLNTLKATLKLLKIKPEDTIYIGDDWPDILCMEYVWHSYCPSDSPEYVKSFVKKALNTKSGQGVLAELLNLWLPEILKGR